MRQAFLGGDGVSVRVRITGDEARLNIKEMRLGIEREEFDYPLPLPDAERLFALAGGGRIDKTRHYAPAGDLTWEIDEFHGDNAGLVVAEIELPARDTRFDLPGWVGEEVTDDERYYNVALALRPWRAWRPRNVDGEGDGT
jgi:adenylate cyclase